MMAGQIIELWDFSINYRSDCILYGTFVDLFQKTTSAFFYHTLPCQLLIDEPLGVGNRLHT